MRSLAASQLRDTPLLSVCVPTWNRGTRLADLLNTMGQFLEADSFCREQVELVVVENGSDDATVDILRDFADRHPDLAMSFWTNEVNLGADVNYLRVLEVARGRWAWLIGDDEAVEPSRLPALLDALEDARGLLVLYNPAWAMPGLQCPLDMDLATFLSREHDELGHMINQVGVFVIERTTVFAHLRRAYAEGIGHLHAYAFLTLGSLADGGTLRLIEVPGLLKSNTDAPRWNVMGGQVGAWRSSVAALRNTADLPRRRESRLRAKALTILALFETAQQGRPRAGVAVWMVRQFSWRQKPLGLLAAFLAALPRPVARGLVRLAFRWRGKAVPRLEQNDGY